MFDNKDAYFDYTTVIRVADLFYPENEDYYPTKFFLSMLHLLNLL
jgi:hypothetical protein